MAEWLARTRATAVTIYARDRCVEDFVDLPERSEVLVRPLRQGDTALDEMVRLARSPHDGRALAAEIDAGEHDVVFCFASRLTQAIDVLPFLRTPSLFYAPEPLRSAYEPCPLEPRPTARAAFTRPASAVRLLAGQAASRAIERRRRRLDRRYMSHARRIVTHSQFTRQTLRRVYGAESEVVPLGVDTETFVPAAVDREGWVLSVGALHPLKGHDEVIEALATLPAPRPPLVVIGDRGDQEQALRKLARARGVELEIHSKLAQTQVIDRYQRAGVVACAQRREPFGLVPLEAMACETPVVAVAEGGFRETIDDGATGLLVTRERKALGGAIARVLRDRALASRLGRQGRAEVESRWIWTRTADGYDRLLEELTGKPDR
jgi:glycosyltransferase involved in cell wall biosynthesis